MDYFVIVFINLILIKSLSYSEFFPHCEIGRYLQKNYKILLLTDPFIWNLFLELCYSSLNLLLIYSCHDLLFFQ